LIGKLLGHKLVKLDSTLRGGGGEGTGEESLVMLQWQEKTVDLMTQGKRTVDIAAAREIRPHNS
jgi:hypothetical protein